MSGRLEGLHLGTQRWAHTPGQVTSSELLPLTHSHTLDTILILRSESPWLKLPGSRAGSVGVGGNPLTWLLYALSSAQHTGRG